MPHETEVLALVDRASAIVYRGLSASARSGRDVGERPVARLTGDEGEVSLASGHGARPDRWGARAA
jgi:hypothetical protein